MSVTPAHATSHTPVALIIDRDADTRRMYSEFLQSCSCIVEEAEDGREGLAKAISRRPDVVITETRLPGISGFDLCQLLRQDGATRATPIIVVTGDAFGADVRRAETAGADAVLIKPCLPDQLFATMRRLLAESAELRERSRATRDKARQQVDRSAVLIGKGRATGRRAMLSRSHERHDTTEPPAAPPVLVCPACDQPLTYQRSHIGGVSERHQEQWDYYECASGCGAFQYRQRTRRLRRVL